MNSINPVEKIIFKKGVFEDLANYLTKFESVLIITSKTPKKLYLKALVGFLNEKKLQFSVCEINNNNDNENVLNCTIKAKNFACILSFGAGKVTDIAKVVANNLNIPLIVAPSTISHFGYFNNCAFLNNGIATEKFTCNYPDKIFIDENIIKNSPENFIFSTCCFIFSFAETYFSSLVESKIFATDITYQLNSIKRIINKTSGLINWLNLNRDVAVLNLTDNIIELWANLQSLQQDFPAVMMAAQNYKNNINSCFGRHCLTFSQTLLSVYKFFWTDKNLSYKDIPNYEKSIKILQKKQKNADFFIEFVKKFENFTSAEFKCGNFRMWKDVKNLQEGYDNFWKIWKKNN